MALSPVTYSPWGGMRNADVSVRVRSSLRSEPVRRVVIPAAPTDTGQEQSPQGAGDRVTISAEGQKQARTNAGSSDNNSRAEEPDESRNSESAGTDKQVPENPAGSDTRLTAEEQQALMQLKQRDREVRSHEQAHLANAGGYARGGASFSYQTGPDGRRYAVGGEVPIDISRESTPEQTIQKMRTVRRAAMAPANPSSADRNIAATASKKEAEALRELRTEQQEGGKSLAEGTTNPATEAPDGSEEVSNADATVFGGRISVIA
ncbi:putative metalloprotease CJM1_0395 family protein [Desulfolithobacter sp.]